MRKRFLFRRKQFIGSAKSTTRVNCVVEFGYSRIKAQNIVIKFKKECSNFVVKLSIVPAG